MRAHKQTNQASVQNQASSLSLKKKIIFICFTAALIVFALEILVRATFKSLAEPGMPVPKTGSWAMIPEESWVEYDPDLGWFQKKNCTARLVNQEWDIPIHTNSIGLRGLREYAVLKPADKTRIAVIGDSFTFGFGVHDDESFPALLKKKNPEFEVMNFGVPGYGIDQMAVLLEKKVFLYQPDFVIIAIYPEDFWRATRAFNDAGHGKPYYVLGSSQNLTLHHVPVPPDRNFSTAQFPDVIEKHSFEAFLTQSYLIKLGQRVWTRLNKIAGWEDPDSSREWRLGCAILKQMIQQCLSHEIPLAVVLIPPSRWITGTTEPVQTSLQRLTTQENVPFLDLTPYFRKASSSNTGALYIPDDLHWTPAGHQLAAQQIDLLLKERLHERAE